MFRCSKIEDAFYSNQLRLNGQRLIKKSKTVSWDLASLPLPSPLSVPLLLLLRISQVKVGDTLDLVLSENKESNTVALMRVTPHRVFGETTTEKHRVVLRRWKYLELPKDEAFKS